MTVAISPSAFMAKLEELPELKAFPAAASRLLAEFDNPELSPKRIAEIIRCDPAMAGNLLKMANSPLYGYTGQIRTIEHAVVVLGMKCIRHLTLTMAGASVFAEGETAKSARQSLWLHSLACATVGQVTASHFGVEPDEAFLTGVFHDVGKLVIYDLAHEAYLSLNHREPPDHRLNWESERLGIDHAELGMECADQWGLPGDIAEAIGNHHESELDSPLAACAVASNLLANHWDLTGFSVLSPDAIDQLLEKLSGFGATVDSDLLLQWLEASRLSYQDVIGTLG